MELRQVAVTFAIGRASCLCQCAQKHGKTQEKQTIYVEKIVSETAEGLLAALLVMLGQASCNDFFTQRSKAKMRHNSCASTQKSPFSLT